MWIGQHSHNLSPLTPDQYNKVGCGLASLGLVLLLLLTYAFPSTIRDWLARLLGE